MRFQKVTQNVKPTTFGMTKKIIQINSPVSQNKHHNTHKGDKTCWSLSTKNSKNIFSIINSSSVTKRRQKLLKAFTYNQGTKQEQNALNDKKRYSLIEQKNYKNIVSQELKKLKIVHPDQLIDNNFQQNLSIINFYPQFKTSLQQRRNLVFLKPYMKQSCQLKKQFNQKCFSTMEKFKSQLYRGIFQTQQLFYSHQTHKNSLTLPKQGQTLRNLNTNRTVIQYMTSYQGDSNSQIKLQPPSHKLLVNKKDKKNKNSSISILREKLKNKYKQSNYADKIEKVKVWEGPPSQLYNDMFMNQF